MIDSDKVNKVADIFTGHFINLNIGKNPIAPNFLEVLVGFTYAFERIMVALKELDIFSEGAMSTIINEVRKSASIGVDNKIKAMLEGIKKEDKEDKDGRSG